MTTLRTAVQQALEALYEETAWFGPTPKGAAAITSLRAALAQQDEPVARECSDPMCACRGGPCAECEEGEREKEIEDLRCSLYFYQRRCEALQSWQSKMRDPERTIVCDILANGKTLDPAFAGDRYTAPPQQAEPVQEPVAWMCSNPELMAKGYERFSSRCEGDWNIPVYLSPPQRKPQTIDEAMRLPRAMAQAYEAGYNAGVAAEREACAQVCESRFMGDMTREDMEARRCAAAIRARGNT